MSEKLEELRRRVKALDAGISTMLRGKDDSKGWTWGTVLKAVDQLEAQTRAVRSTVRVHERKERRENCPHPEERRGRALNGESWCCACGESWDAPAAKIATP